MYASDYSNYVITADEKVKELMRQRDAALFQIAEAKLENATLREDKERLDWLEKHLQHVSEVGNPQMDGTRFVGQYRDITGRQHCRMRGHSIRTTIDAARKETKP